VRWLVWSEDGRFGQADAWVFITFSDADGARCPRAARSGGEDAGGPRLDRCLSKKAVLGNAPIDVTGVSLLADAHGCGGWTRVAQHPDPHREQAG